ncbi:tail protein [Aeromonas phage AerS_266]|nr:tail protein [Aeromonas phage AerS_266]
MKDIEIIDIDYTGVNPLYKIEETHKVSEIPTPWIVPGEGPFYEEGLIIYNGGTRLLKDQDFTFETQVPKLTKLLGKAVYLHIELKPHILNSAIELDVIYQKVGNGVISRNKLLELLENALISGGEIDYETQIDGKPSTFYPSAHQMDVRRKEEVIGFGNMLQLFTILKSRVEAQSEKISSLLDEMEKDSWEKLDYIYDLRWNALKNHARRSINPHNLKPVDVNIENIQNFQTATTQQDGEGLRQDLYSTPAGLAKLISESEPDSEEYLFQNELPFSYYGSGIYLPPSITGSFEGLGGDAENSCFVREGNGWLVGLMRHFDGKVKGLYYIYQQIMLDRYNYTPPVLTYFPYNHPDLQAKGINPDYVLAGSGPDLIAICSLPPTMSNIMVSFSNGTLDPNSHSFVEVDIAPLVAAGITAEAGLFGALTISKVGDWVYLVGSSSDITGVTVPPAGAPNNYTIKIFKFPLSALSAPGKPKITPTQISLSYDTVDRVRKPSSPNIRIGEYVKNASGLVTSFLTGFSQPVNITQSHRRRTFIIVENPNVKGVAKLKILASVYWTYNINGTSGGLWSIITPNYDLDFNAGIMTLDPKWKKPILNPLTGESTNLTAEEKKYITDGDNVGGYARLFNSTFTRPAASWVRGFGPVAVYSDSDGGPPYGNVYLPLNETGDSNFDYESVFNPTCKVNDLGQTTAFAISQRLPSPFGVSGFPRFFTDIYEYNGGVKTKPLEQFIATNESGGTIGFNRLTEGGDGNKYLFRESLQSPFIPNRLFGREPNSNYGNTLNLLQTHAIRNWPQKRDKYSTTHSIAGYVHQPKKNSWNTTTFPGLANPSIEQRSVDSSLGRMFLPITMKWDYNENTKQLVPSHKPEEIIVLTKEQYLDIPKQYIGARFVDVMDIIVSVDLCPYPGPESTTVYASTMTVVYHYSQDPTITRGFIITFNWSPNGIDSVTGYKKITINVLTTRTYCTPLNKYSDSPVVDLTPGSDICNTDVYTLSSGYWIAGYGAKGVTLLKPRSEVYSVGETNNELIVHTYSGCTMPTVGNMNSPNVRLDKRKYQGCPELYFHPANVFGYYTQTTVAVDGIGLLNGYLPAASGGAMNIGRPIDPTLITQNNGFTTNDLGFLGATFVQDNWTVFINSDVNVTFNGYSMLASKKTFDLRLYSDNYRNSVFYLYCSAVGSRGVYEITKTLKHADGHNLLVSKITTGENGIITIDLYQPFAISGYPLTRVRDAGIPVSSGKLSEVGTYQFIKQSELYGGDIPTRDRSILDITMNNKWPRLDGETDPEIPLPPA